MTRFTSWPAHKSIDDSRTFLAYAISRYTNGEPMGYAVVETATNHLIGTCGVENFAERHKRAEIAYAIASSHWDKGFATEAALRGRRSRVPRAPAQPAPVVLPRREHRLGPRDGEAGHDLRGRSATTSSSKAATTTSGIIRSCETSGSCRPPPRVSSDPWQTTGSAWSRRA